jgi:hypothetical protein
VGRRQGRAEAGEHRNTPGASKEKEKKKEKSEGEVG